MKENVEETSEEHQKVKTGLFGTFGVVRELGSKKKNDLSLNQDEEDEEDLIVACDSIALSQSIEEEETTMGNETTKEIPSGMILEKERKKNSGNQGKDMNLDNEDEKKKTREPLTRIDIDTEVVKQMEFDWEEGTNCNENSLASSLSSVSKT